MEASVVTRRQPHKVLEEKSIPSRGNSHSKGPDAGRRWAFSKRRKKVDVALRYNTKCVREGCQGPDHGLCEHE